jgi:RimJ/RimL family protein N-acetyltransferase
VPVDVRLLGSDDRDALERFLLAHADSSLFLRSNVRAAGLVDDGRPFSGTYAGAFDGGLRAVAAHYWNGNVIVQAPVALAAVVRAAVERSGRPVSGLNGPWDQVCAARRALGLAERRASMDSRDGLFALALDDLVRPPALDAPGVRCRATRADDLDLVAAWRIAYAKELMHATDGSRWVLEARADMERLHELGSAWILERDGRPVAFSAFNAWLPDVVQIGGVYTPPALRSRGYARAAVAGSLAAVAASGVRRAVLFTGDDNGPAERAYTAIGFRLVGDYGLVLF